MEDTALPRWRIGVLAERVGVSETLLRAWETRYGLLNPARTTGGYRVYGPEDEQRALAMIEARERGVPAAQAAADILAADRGAGAPRVAAQGADAADRPAGPDPADAVADLEAAMVAYDVVRMHDVIDRVLARMSVETAISEVLLPFLARVGRGWAEGTVEVADEHLASDLVRGRLAALALGPAARTGPLALLACPPGERHDVAMKAFEVVLLRGGWRTRFLGPDTPLSSLVAAADVVRPDLVVLAATRAEVLDLDGPEDETLRELAARYPLAVAGAGATPERAARWGALHLAGGPVAAARELVAARRPGLAPQG